MENTTPQPARVTTTYQAQYADPIHVRAGEPVEVSEKTDNWQGHTWVWCTDVRGKSGWVPQPYLIQRDRTWIVHRDYNAVELSVQAGETVQVAEAQSGWLWCTNAAGQAGWVPAANITLPANPPPDMV
jgi:uncharacterized protein YgiM (DUF1202 family)